MDVEHGLGVHPGPGEPVRAAQRDVDDHGLDPLDPHLAHRTLSILKAT
jgi:hypothetical protein